MKCKYNEDLDCRYVNTSGMTMDKDCHECELYGGRSCFESTTYILGIIILIILLFI